MRGRLIGVKRRPPRSAIRYGQDLQTKGNPMTEHLIDVRTIPPRDRHPSIFAAFDGLPVGAAFILANDHDPRPLFYQFNAERPGEFAWEYVEAGPAEWRVRIGRVAQAPRERGSSCCGTCG